VFFISQALLILTLQILHSEFPLCDVINQMFLAFGGVNNSMPRIACVGGGIGARYRDLGTCRYIFHAISSLPHPKFSSSSESFSTSHAHIFRLPNPKTAQHNSDSMTRGEVESGERRIRSDKWGDEAAMSIGVAKGQQGRRRVRWVIMKTDVPMTAGQPTKAPNDCIHHGKANLIPTPAKRVADSSLMAPTRWRTGEDEPKPSIRYLLGQL
jgi:hypothetical protein